FWKKSEAYDFEKYKIYYSLNNFSSIEYASLYSEINTANDTRFLIAGLENIKTYYFAITAVDNAGNEDLIPSEVVTASPLSSLKDETGPAVISNLEVVETGVVSAAFQWNSPADAETGRPEKYALRYSLIPINSYSDFLSAQSDTMISLKIPMNQEAVDSYILTNLAPDNLYYAAIVSIDINGNTSGLKTFSFKTISGKSSHIVISEVAVGAGDASKEYIELYNPGLVSVDLSKYKLKISGNIINLTYKNNFIYGYGFYLITTDNFTEYDACWSGAKLSGGGGSSIQILDENQNAVDAVAWSENGSGHNEYKEGNIITLAFSTNQSIERKAKYNSTSTSMTSGSDSVSGNAFDSDDNAFDFVANNSVSYQNSDSQYEYSYGAIDKDTLPPSAITTLQTFANFENGSVLLIWKRVNDYDQYSSNNNAYNLIKYSVDEIKDDTDFKNAITAAGSLKNASDTLMWYSVNNLEEGKYYYFAVKSFDRFGNYSQISNVVRASAYVM
ncbi:MAG TPA: lamin tail domain-containing protein, partial [bacterium]|nr:lamin tail domain-containing protein [bacterium]